MNGDGSVPHRRALPFLLAALAVSVIFALLATGYRRAAQERDRLKAAVEDCAGERDAAKTMLDAAAPDVEALRQELERQARECDELRSRLAAVQAAVPRSARER